MDYYKCDKCGRVFDEFEMNFMQAQELKVTLCGECNHLTKEEEQKYLRGIKKAHSLLGVGGEDDRV